MRAFLIILVVVSTAKAIMDPIIGPAGKRVVAAATCDENLLEEQCAAELQSVKNNLEQLSFISLQMEVLRGQPSAEVTLSYGNFCQAINRLANCGLNFAKQHCSAADQADAKKAMQELAAEMEESTTDLSKVHPDCAKMVELLKSA